MSPGENYQIALDTFLRIQERFPDLDMVLDRKPSNDWLELTLDILSQRGLPADIHLDLQGGDELTFSVGPFFGEWFPCNDEKVQSDFFDCVVGYLSGEYLFEEHWRGGKAVRSSLKRPDGTVASNWLTISALWPWPSKTIRTNQRVIA